MIATGRPGMKGSVRGSVRSSDGVEILTKKQGLRYFSDQKSIQGLLMPFFGL